MMLRATIRPERQTCDGVEVRLCPRCGIDLGLNSVIAVMEGSEPTVIINAEGSRTTPSVVAFSKKKEKLAGQLARRQAVLNPENTISSIKRFVGRRYDEVEVERERVPYRIKRGKHGEVRIYVPSIDEELTLNCQPMY